MIFVNCDGSITGGNPGGRGYTGFVVRDYDGQILHKHSDDLGVHPAMTNNVAEYAAVLSALNWLRQQGRLGPVRIATDSQLVVRQLQDVYQCVAPVLRRLRDLIWEQAKNFEAISYMWVPREKNTEADDMSKSLQ